MIKSKKKLTKYKHTKTQIGLAAEGDSMISIGTGDFGRFKQVLHVPNLADNLASLPKIIDDGSSVLLNKTEIKVYGPENTPMFKKPPKMRAQGKPLLLQRSRHSLRNCQAGKYKTKQQGDTTAN